MNGKVTDATQLLERAYLLGIDKEFRDDLRSTLNALTAPSTAGQGGAVAEALLWLRSALDCKDYHWDADQREAAEFAYAAALAALQPVGQEPVAFDRLHAIVGAANLWWQQSGHQQFTGTPEWVPQALQALGEIDSGAPAYVEPAQTEQAPIGYRWRHSANEPWQYSNVPCGWEWEAVYAKPAQAMDLGNERARLCIQSLLEWVDGNAETKEESGFHLLEKEAVEVMGDLSGQAADLRNFRTAVMHAYGVIENEAMRAKLGELPDLIDSGKAVQS